VKVIAGALTGFEGVVEEVFSSKRQLQARISVAGREVVVENLDFCQVESV
jgi:transcription antitermination factor NusG